MSLMWKRYVLNRVGKSPVFFKTRFKKKTGLKKNQPSGFFGFLFFFLVLVFWIFAQKREF
jgi:hypothetical protein